MSPSVLINEILCTKVGETVVITADIYSDENVVNSTASSIYATGAKPMVVQIASPSGAGNATVPRIFMTPGHISIVPTGKLIDDQRVLNV